MEVAMSSGGNRVTSLEGRAPALARVRAAVLAAAAAPGGCPAGALHARVVQLLGRTEGEIGREVESALGLLIVTGAVDEIGGRLVPALGARAVG
jgi:hypothetical protein